MLRSNSLAQGVVAEGTTETLKRFTHRDREEYWAFEHAFGHHGLYLSPYQVWPINGVSHRARSLLGSMSVSCRRARIDWINGGADNAPHQGR